MLKFMRNKVVDVQLRPDGDLAVHGILDDDVYSLELNLVIGLPDFEIKNIQGKWHRWTTPECPRAIGFIDGALGLRLLDENFSPTVHKVVGRRACRHFANLLLECAHSAREAALLASWDQAKAADPSLNPADFFRRNTKPAAPVQEKATMPAEARAAEPAPSAPEITPVRRPRGAGPVVDLHVHTFPASPCASSGVDQVVLEAKRIGLDGICLTDHNYVWSADEVERLRREHDFLVLRGNEITTDQGDVLVFGLERDVKGVIHLEDLRREVLDSGGYMIAAHPFRGFLTFNASQLGLTPEKAMERSMFRQVDSIEVLNGKVTPRENEFSSRVAAGLGFSGTGGSDAHQVDEVGRYAVEFDRAVENETDLIAALKSGAFRPVAFRDEPGE
ncbi:MAG: PHP domain-containing protein [Pseudomonadota bacterium]